MNLQSLLEFRYAGNALLEYSIVFALQMFLYLVAAGFFTVLYGYLIRLNIGSRVELRANYPRQLLIDVKRSITTCAIIALYFYISFAFIEQVYPFDAVSVVLHVLVFLVAYDFYMYVTHRALHAPRLRRFHAVHHTAISTTPWSCLTMHPVEALINYLPFLLFAAFSSVSLLEFLAIHAYLIFGIAHGHGNYALVARTPGFSMAGELWSFHQRHHSDGRANYGYLFTHYDWLFGTRHLDDETAEAKR